MPGGWEEVPPGESFLQAFLAEVAGGWTFPRMLSDLVSQTRGPETLDGFGLEIELHGNKIFSNQ